MDILTNNTYYLTQYALDRNYDDKLDAKDYLYTLHIIYATDTLVFNSNMTLKATIPEYHARMDFKTGTYSWKLNKETNQLNVFNATDSLKYKISEVSNERLILKNLSGNNEGYFFIYECKKD